jgi:Kdo2-lipid IVA lauroyltransferase/acyltransferase
MEWSLNNSVRQFKRWRKKILGAVAGRIAVILIRAIRHADRIRIARITGRLLRRFGPWLPEQRLARANLRAAFPEKPDHEIEKILDGSWDNLGRVAAEFAFLDRLHVQRPGDPPTADVIYEEDDLRRFEEMRAAPKPTAFFAAHLGNWELPGLVATRAGLESAVLYRAPGLREVADAVLEIRKGCMGTLIASGFDAPFRLSGALARGCNVGMLVDQYDIRGVEVNFFGRTCKVSPLIAQLARNTDCNIRGIRIIRLADGNHFRAEMTEPIELPRDAENRVDITRTMQAVTSVIESWVREYPEQWLWQHRRWR